MLMLVCMGITTPTITTATMDSPGMCLDARGVMLKLRQRLMLMPDIMDTILIMAMGDTMATILDKHYAELERDAYSGNLHVSAHLASSTNQNIKSEQFSIHLVQKFTLMLFGNKKFLTKKKKKKKKK